MPKNTTATPATVDETTIATVTQALSAHPDGATTRALATATGLSTSTVGRALTAMHKTGTATCTGANGKPRTTDTWTPVTTAPATGPDTNPTAGTPGSETQTDDPGPATSVPASPSTRPIPNAPAGNADHMKIAMVAGILTDHPNGIPAITVVDQSGLRAAIVSRVLAAMETAGAASRTTDPDTGDELWTRGEADLATVNLANTATYRVCPTCGHRSRTRTSVTVRRASSSAPGHNGDGQPTLGRNELRTLVSDFLTTHPGHEFTAATIARELGGRSSGAIGNALAKLVTTGEAALVRETPMTYSATTASR